MERERQRETHTHTQRERNRERERERERATYYTVTYRTNRHGCLLGLIQVITFLFESSMSRMSVLWSPHSFLLGIQIYLVAIYRVYNHTNIQRNVALHMVNIKPSQQASI